MPPTLHIFNPDTDYALGADTVSYTPTAKVTAMRRELAMPASCRPWLRREWPWPT